MFKKTICPLAISAALVLSACGPQNPPPPPPQDQSQVPVAPPPAATPAPAPAPVPEAPRPKPRPQYEPRVEREREYAPPPPPRQVCEDCGVIASVRQVRVEGQATALGTIGGAGAGAAAGGQFGKKSGKFAMMALGAIGGAFAGREVESQIRAKEVYKVDVNMDAGGTREVTMDDLGGVGVGTRVHVNGNSLAIAN